MQGKTVSSEEKKKMKGTNSMNRIPTFHWFIIIFWGLDWTKFRAAWWPIILEASVTALDRMVFLPDFESEWASLAIQ
jgi:hypothetical protein